MPRSSILIATGAALSLASVATAAPQRTTATYQDWTVRCVMQGKVKSCEMAQTMQIKGQSRPIAQVAIGRQPKGGALKIVFEVPVNVWLPEGVKLKTGDKKADVAANFDRCIPVGCFAEAEISEAEIKALGARKKAGRLAFKNAGKQQIAIPVSFKGFADAYSALPKP